MLTHTLYGLVAASGGPSVNTTGVVAWLVKYIVPLLLAFIGISILARSNQGQTSKNAITLGNALLGIMVIGGGVLLFAFGSDLVNLAFGK